MGIPHENIRCRYEFIRNKYRLVYYRYFLVNEFAGIVGIVTGFYGGTTRKKLTSTLINLIAGINNIQFKRRKGILSINVRFVYLDPCVFGAIKRYNEIGLR